MTVTKVYGPSPFQREPMRPAGAMCRHCLNRPARIHKQWTHLASDYCSDRCKTNHKAQGTREAQRVEAEAIRCLLGLPDGRGPTFTLPELQAIRRRLARVLPYGGLAMMPARRYRRRRVA